MRSPAAVSPSTPASPVGTSTTEATQSDTQTWLDPSLDMAVRPMSMEGFPTAVCAHTAVWTGTEVLLWGGDEAFPSEDDGYAPVDPIGRADGGIYDPSADRWRPLPAAPLAGRYDHVAAWTGTEMLVFGGRDAARAFGDGAAFDPRTGTWRPLSLDGAPSPRSSPGAVWTGRELVVVAGHGSQGEPRDDAFAYDPATNAWRPLGTLAPRDRPTAVWTGTEVIAWGGTTSPRAPKGERLVDGRWRPLASAGAPPVRDQQAVVWADTHLVVWGGLDADGSPTVDGARWDPTADAWTPMSTTNTHPRVVQGAVFTGEVVAVLGGVDMMDYDEPPGSLGLYNPALDRWWSLPGPYPSDDIAITWTGTELVAWGGFDGTNMSPMGERVRLR